MSVKYYFTLYPVGSVCFGLVVGLCWHGLLVLFMLFMVLISVLLYFAGLFCWIGFLSCSDFVHGVDVVCSCCSWF